jgi:hypothetical protein
MKLLIFLFMFFMISALLIISNNGLSFIRDENIGKFSELYVDWLNELYFNFQGLTGNVVEQNWLPEK